MRGAEVLKGRDDESRTFLQLVGEHRLVILDGKSGVGKSSLLQASLVPTLRDKRYAVALCSDWSDVGEAVPHHLLGAKIWTALGDEPLFKDDSLPTISSFSPNAKIFDELEADRNESGRRTVVILDQFEELIRYSPERATQIIDVVARLNNHYSLTVVISLRSEYLHELRRLERMVRAFSYATYELQPIGDDLALEVITAPNSAQSQHITDEAAGLLAKVWRDARRLDMTRGTSVDEIGLLHLQAALYAMHWASAGRSGPISAADVGSFVGDRDSVAVFEAAMIAAVNRKLDHCTEEARDLIDPYLLHGARAYVARIAPHLSSGGFKLHREAAELAVQTIDDEIESLRGDSMPWSWPSVLRTLVARATQLTRQDELGDSDAAEIDVLGDTWYELARTLISDEVADDIREAMHAEVDAESRTSGAMMGLPAAAVLIEELRRLALAMAWMTHTHLVRMSTPAADRTMISLIHDRFGEGLSAWSGPVRREPAGPLHAITAPQAAELIWNEDPNVQGTVDKSRVLANLRWRSAFIVANFRHAVLFNCDFRGSMFKNCTFEGVAFVNCRLEGTMFESCRVVGRAEEPLDGRDNRPSSFAVEQDGIDTTHLRTSLARYFLVDDGKNALYSYLPGRPVELLDPDDISDGTTKDTAWSVPKSGLVIYGGRVSTFVCRGMKFKGNQPSESSMSFRYVAGSGLEIADQADSGSYEIFSSALRHVSITPLRRRVKSSSRATVEVSIRGSAVIQTWFGENLAGHATCSDSLLANVWNNSTDFTVTVLDDCPYQGLVGCTVVSGSPLVDGEPTIQVTDLAPVILDRSTLMNFIQDPSHTV